MADDLAGLPTNVNWNDPNTQQFFGKLKEAIDKYPNIRDLITAVPEIAQVVYEAITSPTPPTSEVLQARIQATNWWKNTPPSVRDWVRVKASDPAKANNQWLTQFQHIQNLVWQQGLNLTQEQIGNIATNSLEGGWNDEQLRGNLGYYSAYDPKKKPMGSLGARMDEIKKQASDYLVTMSDKGAWDLAMKEFQGAINGDYLGEYLKDIAKTQFAEPIQKAIDQGMTVRQYAEPYVQKAAQLLEMDPSQIDLTNSKWSRPLTTIDQKGNKTVMSLNDWENTIRTDSVYGWDYTKNANELASAAGMKILQRFGAQ